MSSDTDPTASEQKALPPRRPVETILGKDIFLPLDREPEDPAGPVGHALREVSRRQYAQGHSERRSPALCEEAVSPAHDHPRLCSRDACSKVSRRKGGGMNEDRFNFLLGFAIVCAICVVMCIAITVSALRARDEARLSERQSWEQAHELRATLAAQGGIQTF